MFSGLEWIEKAGAPAEALEALRSAAPIVLPERLIDLLAFSNGGEGPLAVQPFNFVLYPAGEIAQIERDGDYKEFFPGFFVFGGNGGGEAIAFDLRVGSAPYPVIAFDMTNIDLEESVLPIAPSFDEFLALVGIDEE